MAEMGEPSFLGLDFFGEGERFGEAHVGGVRLVAQSIDDQMADAVDLFNGEFWDDFAVAEVSDEGLIILGEKVAEDVGAAVFDGERGDGGGADLEGASDEFWGGADVTWPAIFAIEGEFENALEIGHGFWGGVDGEIFAAVAEGAEVIEAHDVIGMGVGEDHGVEAAEAFAEGLGAEIGAGVDHPSGFGGLEINGGAGALVVRVCGSADRAIATDHGDALGGSGAEKSEMERGHLGWTISQEGDGWQSSGRDWVGMS